MLASHVALGGFHARLDFSGRFFSFFFLFFLFLFFFLPSLSQLSNWLATSLDRNGVKKTNAMELAVWGHSGQVCNVGTYVMSTIIIFPCPSPLQQAKHKNLLHPSRENYRGRSRLGI
ncbi:hypothetical protein F4813DRAFT_342765 [Daldinia decipiens]|uniref:uncharacterized protein n=1 Tax=Daldinia decipiens TaxID=326647 RepID=UPI0020C1F68A|nr:uncharacterized protein F4813DRAFT_342765 [Daldinia decipiens]KAI1663038.1 hypothetical protein F4813DRAFT_342765 [Daldinia decipiens]